MDMTSKPQVLENTVAKCDTDPLIFGFSRDQAGAIRQLSWDDIVKQPTNEPDEWRWIHLNRESVQVHEWLSDRGAPDSAVCNVLLQEDSRPRIIKHLGGYLINLRGVNMNPGAEPEDMISLRMWATSNLIITTRARRVLAAEDLKNAFLAGTPPATSGATIAFLANRLVSRIGPVVSDLDDAVDTLEDEILESKVHSSRVSIRGFRRTVLSLRRYIAPQREAIAGFLREADSFLSAEDKHQLRETYDAIARVAEDLDLIRERAMLLHEQLVEERAEAMNSRLFLLAIISAIFLPLGFVTGLFGVNIGGMPGVDNPYAFVMLCLAIVIFSSVSVVVFLKMKWL